MRSLILGTMLLINFIFIVPVYAEQDIYHISFDQLQNFAITKSPEIRSIEETYNINISEGEIDLQWSNPTVGYSQEFVKNDSDEEREHYITMSKEFEMPWIYFLRKKYWDLEFDAEEYKKKQKAINFISEIKTGYVEISLAEKQIKKLNKLKTLVNRTSDIATAQYEEGEISGIQQNLITMSVNNLNSRVAGIVDKKRKLKTNWKSKMGLDSSDEIEFTTEISYESFDKEPLETLLTAISQNPGLIGREKAVESTKKKLELEEKSLITGFELFGGYKRVTPDFNGFLFGLSLSLPILNQNQPRINKTQALLEKAENNFTSYKLSLRNEIEERIQSVKHYNALLDELTPQFQSSRDLMNKAVFSYEEGQISLTEFLSAMQIYAENAEQYYTLLTEFYKNIFALESLVNKNLVSFKEYEDLNGDSYVE